LRILVVRKYFSRGKYYFICLSKNRFSLHVIVGMTLCHILN
jgi:hypothetical protein